MLCEIATHLAATVPDDILGSFSNDDGDGNANGKKTKSLIRKNNTSARDSFLYISFPRLHEYDLKMPNFTIYATCKRMQHCWTTSTTIVGCHMLRPFANLLHAIACFFWQNKAMFLLNIKGRFASRDVCASAERP